MSPRLRGKPPESHILALMLGASSAYSRLPVPTSEIWQAGSRLLPFWIYCQLSLAVVAATGGVVASCPVSCLAVRY